MLCKVLLLVTLAVCLVAIAHAGMEDDEAVRFANTYRAILFKAKRSPSMGLSLAEYMASPKGGENFHFIPSGRK